MDVTITPSIKPPLLIPTTSCSSNGITSMARPPSASDTPLPTFALPTVSAGIAALITPTTSPREFDIPGTNDNNNNQNDTTGIVVSGSSGWSSNSDFNLNYGAKINHNDVNSSRPLELAREALILTSRSETPLSSSAAQVLSPRRALPTNKKPASPPSIPQISSGSGLRLNKFVRRLHDMLQSEKDSGIVEWRRGLLVLHSTDAFAKTILPKYFNTRNFKTFRRQLNYYGFVHVRSFSTTGSTTTALWVNRDLAKLGSADISSVLLLKRVEPCEAAKTAEGRRVRKELAIFTVEEDIGVSPKTLQMEQIRSLALRAGEDCSFLATSTTPSATITSSAAPLPPGKSTSTANTTTSNTSNAADPPMIFSSSSSVADVRQCPTTTTTTITPSTSVVPSINQRQPQQQPLQQQQPQQDFLSTTLPLPSTCLRLSPSSMQKMMSSNDSDFIKPTYFTRTETTTNNKNPTVLGLVDAFTAAAAATVTPNAITTTFPVPTATASNYCANSTTGSANRTAATTTINNVTANATRTLPIIPDISTTPAGATPAATTRRNDSIVNVVNSDNESASAANLLLMLSKGVDKTTSATPMSCINDKYKTTNPATTVV